MIDLKQISGLNLKLDEKTNSLAFGSGLRRIVPGVRTLDNMRKVLLDPEAKGPEKVYFMYRGITERFGIRYDITLIPPGFLGREYVKTLGHYHPPAGGLEKGASYPEVYGVLNGQAIYLLQKRKEGKDLELEDVALIKASKGDRVLIPPDYGHVTVNPGREALVMGNLVCSGFQSVYEPFLKAKGAGYYLIKEKGVLELVRNKNYKAVPKAREVKPQTIPLLGLGERPLYLVFRENPGVFEYLRNPGMYGKALV